MKVFRTIPSHCLLVWAAIAAPAAFAQSGTWNLSGGGNWANAGSWNPAAIPGNNAGDIVGLNNNITSAANVNLQTGNRTAGILSIGDSNDSHAFTLSSGGAFLTLNNSGSGAQIIESGAINDTISAPLILADGLSTSVAGSLTISGSISETGGTRSITKTGAGSLFLSGNNSYTGTTVINVGIVSISHANALGSTAGATTIAATGNGTTGGRLFVSGNITVAENFIITGNTESAGFQPAINNQAGSNTLSGNITLSNPAGGIRIGAAGGTSLLLSGTISQTTSSQAIVLQANGNSTLITVSNAIANNGGGLTIFGTALTGNGVVQLNSASGSGIGNTGINQNGTLRAGVANALNTAGNLTIGVNGTNNDRGTFDLNGFDQTINGLVGTPAGTSPSGNEFRIVTNSAVSGSGVLTVGNGGATATFNGVIINGPTASVALAKVGSGTQTLAGNNTYTGATTISDGTLALGVNGSIDNTSVVALAGGTFSVAAKAGGYSTSNLTGTGTVVGSLTVTNELAIGNSPGTVAFENLTLGASATFAYEVTGGGSTADLGNISGLLDLGGATLSMAQLGAYTLGDRFTLFGYQTGNLTGTFNGLSQNATFTAAGGDWRINYTDSSAGLNGGSGTSFVTVMAVPEPGSLAVLACGGIVLAIVCRRRMNAP